MTKHSHCETALRQGADLYRELQQWKRSWRQRLLPLPLAAPGPAPDPRDTPFRRSSPLHAYYPLLFQEAFPEVPGDVFRDLALADRLCTEHLLHWDRALDLREKTHPVHLLLARAEHGQSLKRLYRLFPPGHSFWAYFHLLEAETWNAVREERLHHLRRLVPFSLDRFRALARGKTALLKACTAGLCFFADREIDLGWVGAALDAHHLGLVLLDDLEDWKEDFLRGNYTFLLTRLLLVTGLAAKVRHGAAVPLREVGTLLYGTGLAERNLRLAEDSFREAATPAGGPRLPCWQAFNRGFAQRSRSLRRDLEEIRRRGRRPAAAVRPTETNDFAGEAGQAEGVARLGSHGRAPVPERIPEEGSGDDREDRAAARRSLDAVEIAVLRGIRFLAKEQQPGGSFTASRSAHAYLNPAGRPCASLAATLLVVQALSCLRDLHPLLDDSIRKASEWIRRRGAGTDNPFEQENRPEPGDCLSQSTSFESEKSPAQEICPEPKDCGPPRNSPEPGNPLEPGPRPAGAAPSPESPPRQPSENPAPPAGTEARFDRCIRQACRMPMAPGTHFQPAAASAGRAECVPLLIFRLCLALGSGDCLRYPPKPLHDHLLNPYRSTGAWGHATGTALVLVCLLTTGYPGPEPHAAAARLCRVQESDGSWPPNAFCREDGLFLGSREATTAWGILALFLYRLAAPLPGVVLDRDESNENPTPRTGRGATPGPDRTARTATPGTRRTGTAAAPATGETGRDTAPGTIAGPGRPCPLQGPRVVCQPGLPGFLARVAEKTVVRWRESLGGRARSPRRTCEVLPLPETICLGAWEGMPSSFLIPGEPAATAAVNLRTPPAPPFLSTASRPLAVEIVLALTLTLRERLAGAPATGLDWACAAGAALGVCADWWPDRPIWKLAGLTGLEWAWCREQEELLWKQWLPFLEGPLPRWLFGLWPPPDAAAGFTGFLGQRGFIYLASRFFEVLRARSLHPDLPRLLAGNAVGLRRELARAGFRS